MDKIKEKLERLRIDSETATVRAEAAENRVRELESELTDKETAESQLKNKVALLQMDMERQEKRVGEVCTLLFFSQNIFIIPYEYRLLKSMCHSLLYPSLNFCQILFIHSRAR